VTPDRSSPPDDDPEDASRPTVDDEEAFQAALASLFRSAHESGVDVAGGWAVDHPDADDARWSIEVSDAHPRSPEPTPEN